VIANPRTFRCLNCNEMINDSMTQCRYCNVPVDPVAARLVAERQEKANQAYSDASYLRTAVVAMYVFMGLSFIPLVPLVGWGFVIMFFVVLVLLIRWLVKFGRLVTNDADYLKARRSWRFSLVLWIVAIPIGFIIRPLVYFMFQLATR
jgi:ABC-type Na+ efflux pump permease subunit